MSGKVESVPKACSMREATMAVLSLCNLPSMADYGWIIIFYLMAACLCFFILSALVSAEQASTYPDDGGVYLWVKRAFCPKCGFVAFFMQWVENLPWFPACLILSPRRLLMCSGHKYERMKKSGSQRERLDD